MSTRPNLPEFATPEAQAIGEWLAALEAKDRAIAKARKLEPRKPLGRITLAPEPEPDDHVEDDEVNARELMSVPKTGRAWKVG